MGNFLQFIYFLDMIKTPGFFDKFITGDGIYEGEIMTLDFGLWKQRYFLISFKISISSKCLSRKTLDRNKIA